MYTPEPVGRLTLDEYAEFIKKEKPYLVEIEKAVEDCSYGEIDIKLTVRAGVVEKVVFWRGKTWLRDQAVDSKHKG
jgi:hypothetical protein